MSELFKLLGQPTKLIDTHCHFNDPVFEHDFQHILKKVEENNISEIWDISINVSTSEESVKISSQNTGIKSFVGIDPEIFIPNSSQFLGFDLGDEWMNEEMQKIRSIIMNNLENIKGIGETGLDYYWIANISEDEQAFSKLFQEKLFRRHLKLASELNLPLSIHSRNAEEDCLRIVKEYKTYGIFHSFTGKLETAQEIINAGWGVGVNGIITFKNAAELREMYKSLLKDKEIKSIEDIYKAGIYFETDAPFLTPEGNRGERNDPSLLKNVYEYFISNVLKPN